MINHGDFSGSRVKNRWTGTIDYLIELDGSKWHLSEKDVGDLVVLLLELQQVGFDKQKEV